MSKITQHRQSAKKTLLFVVAVSVVLGGGCDREEKHAPDLSASLRELSSELSSTERSRQNAKETPSDIALFCGDCHALPKPESFVREVWYDEIEKGFEFYARSGRTDLKPPALQRVLNYYREYAPARIDFPAPPDVDTEWRSRFELQKVNWDDGGRLAPATACVRWLRFMPEGEWRMIVTDMRDGSVSEVTPSRALSTRRLIGRVGHAARVTTADLNKDGNTDLVVADLGSFSPYDHVLGKVVCLQRDASNREFQEVVIAEGLGRVADVEVADLAGDSSPDLVVAEFGHRRAGSIRLLTNVTKEGGQLRFLDKKLDSRPGAIRIPLNDWDLDGALDFAAVISQEFECVELFINRGPKFERHRVSNGDDLTFGSVCIELADVDQDGDQDILYVNGDTFDNNFANRSHGIQILENLGDLTFRAHRLIELPGAYRALASDMDGDGDQDILAVANLPTTVYPTSITEQVPASIVLLENVKPLTYVTHVLERGTPRYPALEVGDFDNDGKMDFVVGTQLFGTDPVDSAAAKLPRLMLWWQK